MKRRDESNTHPSTGRRRRSQKLGELEKNGNCSYPVGEKVAWHGIAWRTVPAGKNGTAQRSVRDPFVYLFINEGNETGNLIFDLCFPMAPLDVEKSPLGPEKEEKVEDKRGTGMVRACGRAGRLPVTAGSASWAG